MIELCPTKDNVKSIERYDEVNTLENYVLNTCGTDKYRDDMKATKKLQVDIPYPLHNRFKTACFIRGVNMRTIVNILIDEWLRDHQ